MHIPSNEIMYVCGYHAKKYMYEYVYTQLCGVYVYAYYWNYVKYTSIYIPSDLFYETISANFYSVWYFNLLPFLWGDMHAWDG